MKFMQLETGYVRADKVEFLTVVGEMIPSEGDETIAVEKYSVSALLTENEITVSPYFDTYGEADLCMKSLVKHIEGICEAKS